MTPLVRTGLRVTGTVQGVGFRPTVHRLATAAGLAGFVRNDSAGVWIELEGEPEQVERFPILLRSGAPKLSRIDGIELSELPPRGDREFLVIESSAATDVRARIPADAATCAECLRELFDRADRRYRYPFINCTDCGPRYTIVRDVPYDRAKTTMAAFSLCRLCQAEYEDPASRRFHAEATACADCGPHLEFFRGGTQILHREDALFAAVRALRDGQIVAVKGLGGFHLAVDATNDQAVRRLRQRKNRPHKPLALMARDLELASSIVETSHQTRQLLASPARPIVLLPKRTSAIAAEVAPRLDELGVMLPYTPLHHLLLHDGPPLLVMTSGNRSEEPIARTNEEAIEKLGSIVDAFLVHDREIHTRADDSVVRQNPIRRSRGYVPEPIALGFSAPPVLAVGAELKNTICLTRGSEAFLSQHIGDLENAESFAFFEEVIRKAEQLLAVRPAVIAHDLHPDYFSTRWALQSGLKRVAVQHHHAHIASCLAEHGRTGPVIGVAFDGTGCGPAGELWGGEILIADLTEFRRIAHLRPIALAGGEAAIREPWRLAVAALMDAGEPVDDTPRVRLIRKLIEKRVATPLSTGAGRWFDAVAALCGIRDEISYEAQAAVELEAIAASEECAPYRYEINSEIDLRPMVREVVADLRNGVSVPIIAARFHETMAQAVADASRAAARETRLNTVALSGGCFQNRRLTNRCRALLESSGFEVLTHQRVPPNDGGIALGQAAVAAFRSRK